MGQGSQGKSNRDKGDQSGGGCGPSDPFPIEVGKPLYKNNNCIPCVKSSSPSYYLKVKQDFPERFERLNEVEKTLGRSVCKIDMNTVKKRYPDKYEPYTRYWRPQLHEIPLDIEPMDNTNDVECGIFCLMAEDKL